MIDLHLDGFEIQTILTALKIMLDSDSISDSDKRDAERVRGVIYEEKYHWNKGRATKRRLWESVSK